MTASGGSGSGSVGDKAAELEAALAQLAAEGRPDQVAAFRELIDRGLLGAEQVIEALTLAEDLATAMCDDEVTREQASSLAQQLALRHAGKARPQ